MAAERKAAMELTTLVVDDEPEAVELVEFNLKQAGYAVITAIDQLHYIPNRNASELALIAAFKRRRGRMRVVLPAASDRLNKRPRDLSLMSGPDVSTRDAGAGEIPGIDNQIRALRESFKQIEARLSRIEYVLTQPGAKARR